MGSYVSKKKSVLTPQDAMELAIKEARLGAGFVSPNPLVGCVIIDRDGRLVSTGYHQKYGGDHAEIEALKGLSEDQLDGARMFVTLEPCAHDGKTPSCAKRIAKLPLASVTYGMIDPYPEVNGKGIEIIRKAGITCEMLEGASESLKNELEELPEIFLHNTKTKKPFVAMKVASSLDGQMGLKTGESKWISNDKSREYVYTMPCSLAVARY
jgi:diaminohydroxyphosphoribosylaminopyrimidine deaminase/5-amino-6-(5-phosphoribosylamino)uracil reductase